MIFLPPLNENLQKLYCYNNQLISLQLLNKNLKELYYYNNPINEIINTENITQNIGFTLINIKIQKLNNFRHLYYCLKFKKQFRNWLWIKVREPFIMKKYHPKYLIKNLYEDTTGKKV